jgi:hypothetical protein
MKHKFSGRTTWLSMMSALFILLSCITCWSGQIKDVSREKYNPDDYRAFKNYPMLLFDTATGKFDNSFREDELGRLIKLWKQVRHEFMYAHADVAPTCLQTTKASYILGDRTFIKKHVVFILDKHPGVYQWYEGKEPLKDHGCCVHTQFINGDDLVIDVDGKYGLPTFNEMMGREQNNLKSPADAVALVDLYMNFSSRVYPIRKENVRDCIVHIDKRYKNRFGYDAKVLNQIEPPKARSVKGGFEVVFFTFGELVIQTPSGLNKWTIMVKRNGQIASKQTQRIELCATSTSPAGEICQ